MAAANHNPFQDKLSISAIHTIFLWFNFSYTFDFKNQVLPYKAWIRWKPLHLPERYRVSVRSHLCMWDSEVFEQWEQLIVLGSFTMSTQSEVTVFEMCSFEIFHQIWCTKGIFKIGSYDLTLHHLFSLSTPLRWIFKNGETQSTDTKLWKTSLLVNK